jgi:hypothetical protein
VLSVKHDSPVASRGARANSVNSENTGKSEMR